MQPMLALHRLSLPRIHGLVLEQIKAKCLEIRSTTKSTEKLQKRKIKSKYENSAAQPSDRTVWLAHRKRILNEIERAWNGEKWKLSGKIDKRANS